MSARVPVTFEPTHMTVLVTPGTRVSESATAAGIILPLPCGGRGVCGQCAVKVLAGELEPPDDIERAGLDAAPAGVRLGCRARVVSPVTLRPLLTPNTASFSAPPDGAVAGILVAAVDIGTTTVAALLADAVSGRELGRVSVLNRQVRFGVDLVSRVAVALSDSFDELRQDAITSVIDALDRVCAEAAVTRGDIHRVVIAGNAVMTALLIGSDMKGFASAPFTAPEALRDPAAAVDLAALISPGASVAAVPAIASFVGGDMVAGLLGAGLACEADCVIYVDIGTNAEIALCEQGRLAVASVAAGPAFEGYGISYGGAIGPGAVTRLSLDADGVSVHVLGDGTAEWICGSGLISAVALLRRTGHLDAAGRLWPSGPLAARFTTHEGETVFALGEDAGPPYILQRDVRALQLAKAAVIAGAQSLVETVGARPVTLVVSGNFGSSLAAEDLMDLGIVPASAAVVRVVQDSALLGAAMIALSPGIITEAVRLAASARHVELASSATFKRLFVRGTRLERTG